MLLFLLLMAKVGVGADKHPRSLIVHHYLVEIAVARAAQRTGFIPLLNGEWMVVEVETFYFGIGR
jgi:hypothetical protein